MKSQITIIVLCLFSLQVPSTARPDDWNDPRSSQANAQSSIKPLVHTTISNCIVDGIDKIRPRKPFTVQATASCPKASLPGCNTKTDAKALKWTASEGFIIEKASTSFSYSGREGTLTPAAPNPALSTDRRQVSATVSCRGYGCDPEHGGTTAIAFLTGTEVGVEPSDKLRKLIHECVLKSFPEKNQ